MKESVFGKDGMKMLIDSGYKLFDEQTNYIGTKNVIANTQYSLFVRPYNEVMTEFQNFKPGELMKADLDFFAGSIPREIRAKIEDKQRVEPYILYEFFVTRRSRRSNGLGCYQGSSEYSGVKKVYPFGYVLTTQGDELVAYKVVGESHIDKKTKALKEAMEYIIK